MEDAALARAIAGAPGSSVRARACLRAGDYAEAAKLTRRNRWSLAATSDALAADALSARKAWPWPSRARTRWRGPRSSRPCASRARRASRASRPSPSDRPPSPTSAPGGRRRARSLRGLPLGRRAGARRRHRRLHAPEPRRPGAGRGRPGAGARASRGGRRHGAARGQRRGRDAGAAQPRQPRSLPRAMGPRARVDRPARLQSRRALARRTRAAPRPGGRARGPHRGRRGAARLYEETAQAWEAQGRTHDAAESRLEGLARAGARLGRRRPMGPQLDAVNGRPWAAAGFGEHAALAELARGAVAHSRGTRTRRGARSTPPSISRARPGGASGRGKRSTRAPGSPRRRAASRPRGATPRRARDARGDRGQAPARSSRGLLGRSSPSRAAPGPHRHGGRAVDAPLGDGPPRRPGARASGGKHVHLHRPGLAEDRLERILEITRELASEHDVPRLLQRVTDHAVALLGAERGFVVLMGERGELEAHAARDPLGGDEPHARFSRSVADRSSRAASPSSRSARATTSASPRPSACTS
jgi:hypothetical protein